MSSPGVDGVDQRQVEGVAEADDRAEAGLGIRPPSILRSVSGEMPAATATVLGSRSPRAVRMTAPRRRPAATCSAVGNANHGASLAGICIPNQS